MPHDTHGYYFSQFETKETLSTVLLAPDSLVAIRETNAVAMLSAAIRSAAVKGPGGKPKVAECQSSPVHAGRANREPPLGRYAQLTDTREITPKWCIRTRRDEIQRNSGWRRLGSVSLVLVPGRPGMNSKYSP